MSEKCKGKNEKHAISLSPLSNIMVEVEKNELDPAELIIKKNNLTAFERRVNETQEELRKVFTRVEKIYGEYEESRKLYSSKIATLELLHDIQELENILQDEVKNKKVSFRSATTPRLATSFRSKDKVIKRNGR